MSKLIQDWMPPAIRQWNRWRIARRIMRESGVEPQDARLDLSVRSLATIFPGIEQEQVVAVTSQFYRPQNMVLPLVELLTIAAICRHVKPKRIFEIGTYLGSATLTMALNTPPDTEIWTLDLDEARQRQLGFNFEAGADYKRFPEASKIHQLFGDSRSYDYLPHASQMDLVFVDANHTYPFAKSDTEKAFMLVRPGGIVLWDDYDWGEHSECVGVARSLNEASRNKEIFQIENTRMAIHKASENS